MREAARIRLGRVLGGAAVVHDEPVAHRSCGVDPRYLVRKASQRHESGGTPATIVRRYDPIAQEWGAPQALPGLQPMLVGWYFAVDGTGNAYAIRPTTDRWNWSFWPAGVAEMEPSGIIDEAARITAHPGDGAFVWQERTRFAVRRFDQATSSWTEEVELWPTDGSPTIHTIVFGSAGEALAVRRRSDGIDVVVEARRYDRLTETWSDTETVALAPDLQAAGVSYQAFAVLTDSWHHDFVAVPTVISAGRLETRVMRYDPSLGAWSLSRTLEGATTSFEFVSDDFGNVYGYWAPGTLIHFSTATGRWTDTPLEVSGVEFIRQEAGVLAICRRARNLVGYRHFGDGSGWMPARGGGRPSIPASP